MDKLWEANSAPLIVGVNGALCVQCEEVLAFFLERVAHAGLFGQSVHFVHEQYLVCSVCSWCLVL